jgi:putative SOS response-associated peptidase YedK
MCGRLTLTVPDLSAVADEVEAHLDPADALLYRPRYNAAPSDLHFIVREADGQRRLLPARWGFMGAQGRLLINARGETASARPRFREAVAIGRCIVPADGFYEWTGPREDRRPLWFHLRDQRGSGVFFFAGLFEAAEGEPGPAPPRFVVLTTAANDLVAPAHDRMPVILDRESARRWLAAPDSALLTPASDALLAATEVSARVNAVANDDPGCLTPAPQGRGSAQAQLLLL